MIRAAKMGMRPLGEPMSYEEFCETINMPASSQMIGLLYDLYKQAFYEEILKGGSGNDGSN